MEQELKEKQAVSAIRSSDWLCDEAAAAMAWVDSPAEEIPHDVGKACMERLQPLAEPKELVVAVCARVLSREVKRLRQLLETERVIARGAQENATGFREVCERQEGEIKAAREELRAANEIVEGIIAARERTIGNLRRALRDALSTYGPADHIVVTSERIEAWQDALHGADYAGESHNAKAE